MIFIYFSGWCHVKESCQVGDRKNLQSILLTVRSVKTVASFSKMKKASMMSPKSMRCVVTALPPLRKMCNVQSLRSHVIGWLTKWESFRRLQRALHWRLGSGEGSSEKTTPTKGLSLTCQRRFRRIRACHSGAPWNFPSQSRRNDRASPRSHVKIKKTRRMLIFAILLFIFLWIKHLLFPPE